MKVLILIWIVQGCLGASLVGYKTACPEACRGYYDPVCGSNGKTYSSQCFLSIAHCHDVSITFVSRGACAAAVKKCLPTMCFALYQPVCGSDGKTYSNKCQFNGANCHGDLTIVHHRAC